YSPRELNDMSDERIDRYFNKIKGQFQVKAEIREMCIFAVHNIVKDPPFGRMDLVVCRNLLIYFNLPLQKKALQALHFSLNTGGVLFLGKSEATASVPDLFSPLIKNHKIFSRKSISRNSRMKIPMSIDPVDSPKSNFPDARTTAHADFQ